MKYQERRLTPKSLSTKLLISLSCCKTGSSHTRVNQRWRAILTSRSSRIVDHKHIRPKVLHLRIPSSSVMAEVWGNGKAGRIAVGSRWSAELEGHKASRLTLRISVCKMVRKKLKLYVRSLHIAIYVCPKVRKIGLLIAMSWYRSQRYSGNSHWHRNGSIDPYGSSRDR
jgi:hypothetical protein